MGWLSTLKRLYVDYARTQWPNFVIEVVWTVINIFTVLILWSAVVRHVPSNWSLPTLITFSLMLELWVSVSGTTRDIAWSIVEIFIYGSAHLLTKPHPIFVSFFKEGINTGELIALLLKLVVFVPLLLTIWKNVAGLALGLLLMVLSSAGFELFAASFSSLLHSKGSLWRLFYNLEWRLAIIPGDLFKGPLRLLITVAVPVYVAITFPVKLLAGLSGMAPSLLLVAVGWFLIGIWSTKKAMKKLIAYGG